MGTRHAAVMIVLSVLLIAGPTVPGARAQDRAPAAQDGPRAGVIRAEPTHANVPYGPNPRHVMDLYLAPSDGPTPVFVFFHGGGFRAGDKRGFDPQLLDGLLRAGISMAAVNYRRSRTDAYPAAMEDGARAVQFLRQNAAQWNLDPDRIAAGGGSAGGAISLWIALHDDRADPAAEDPVARQSTRLACVVGWEAQTSLDPNYIRTIIPGDAYRHVALLEFFRVRPEDFGTPQARRMFEEASALPQVSPGDPPVLLWCTWPDRPLTPALTANQGIHHPVFARVFAERMAEAEVECVIRRTEDFPEDSALMITERFRGDVVAFLRRQFELAPDRPAGQ